MTEEIKKLSFKEYFVLDKRMVQSGGDLENYYGKELLRHFNELFDKNEEIDFVIFHDTDLDGAGASAQFAEVLSYYEAENSDWQHHFVPLRAGVPFREGVTDHLEEHLSGLRPNSARVFIVLDQAMFYKGYQNLRDKCQKLFWIDHHPLDFTFEEADNPFHFQDDTFLFINPFNSTTLKVHQLLIHSGHKQFRSFAENSAEISIVIDHYDAWKFSEDRKDPLDLFAFGLNTWFFSQTSRTESINRIHDFYKGLFLYTKNTHRLEKFHEAIHEGMEIVKVKEQGSRNAIERTFKTTWTFEGIEHKVGFIFHSDDISDLADRLLRADSELRIAVIVYMAVNGSVRLSIRSIRGLASNGIAKKLGGGGNYQSSGAEFPLSDLAKYMKPFNFDTME